MAKPESKNRFMELEGLRGIAAVVVVVYHFLLIFYLTSFFGHSAVSPVQHIRFEDNLYANPLTGLLSGTFSVAIFFVLSGFVLSIGFFQTGRIEIVKKLAAKRYIRLMLPALASILICLLLIKLGASRIQQAAAITHSGIESQAWSFAPSLLDAFKNGVFGIFVGVPNLYNGVLWTMSLEFVGSFIVFGVLLLAAESKFRWLVYGALVIMTINTWLFGFILGMVFADMFANGFIKQKSRRWFMTIPLVALAVYFGGYPFGDHLQGTAYGFLIKLIPFNGVNYQTIYTLLGAGIIIFVVLWSSQTALLLRRKWLGVLGKHTFSLYLVHVPILYTFTASMFLHLQGPLGYNKAAAAAFIATVPVIGVATYLFQKYIDSNAIRLSSYLTDVYYGKRSIDFGPLVRRTKRAISAFTIEKKVVVLEEEIEVVE